MKKTDVKSRRMAPVETPTDLGGQASKTSLPHSTFARRRIRAVPEDQELPLAYVGALRDYHLLLDEQADQIYATTDPIAERVRKLGGTTLRSIGQISRLQRVADNDADYVTATDMLADLRDDNQQLVSRMRQAHVVCEEHNDVSTTSLIEVWIDEAERRVWFLYEAGRK
jgi:starvation-inducible DNA-binding protein